MTFKTREEFFLAKMAGYDVDISSLTPNVPVNTTEKLMLEIAEQRANSENPESTNDNSSGEQLVAVVIETNYEFTEVISSTHTPGEIRSMFGSNVPMFFYINVQGQFPGMPSNCMVATQYNGQINTDGSVANGPGITIGNYMITIQTDRYVLNKGTA